MVNAYEQQRQDRIRKNQEKLKGLNVPKLEQAPQQRGEVAVAGSRTFLRLFAEQSGCLAAPKKPSADSKKRPAPLREPIRFAHKCVQLLPAAILPPCRLPKG